MRSHPLPESRAYADLMLSELRKVIPCFLKRVDLDDRGVAWSTYLATTRSAMEDLAGELFPDGGAPPEDAPAVQLLDCDPDGEVKLVAAMLYPYTHVPEAALEQRVRAMTADERLAVHPGLRGRPGQPAPQARPGARAAHLPLRRPRRLRRLPRPPAPPHAHDRVAAAQPPPRLHPPRGGRPRRLPPSASTRRWSARPSLHDALAERFPAQAAYAVSLAYKVRFDLHLNAREAMHLLELRTTPQGHPAYRVVGQEMHRLIAEQAGHHAVAEAMRFVDHSPEPSLERLEAERRAEARRQTAALTRFRPLRSVP